MENILYYASIRLDPDLSKRVKIGQVNVGEVAEIGKEVHGCYELIQFNKVVGYVICDQRIPGLYI
jgi:hypothetical protein